MENLCFEFPNTPYKGHFTELGYNAIAMSKVADCWARNIRIVNLSDSGIFQLGVFLHDPGRDAGVVAGRGKGSQRHRPPRDLPGGRRQPDHRFPVQDALYARDHRAGLRGERLRGGPGWTSVSTTTSTCPTPISLRTSTPVKGRDCGSAAGGALGKNSGAWETLWNIRARRALNYPPASFGPAAMNLVGLTTGPAAAAVKDLNGKWFETIKPEESSRGTCTRHNWIGGWAGSAAGGGKRLTPDACPFFPVPVQKMILEAHTDERELDIVSPP